MRGPIRWVYASATLTVDGSFNSFSQAMGLNESEFSVADELLLASSYDFDNQMVVYVVNDMPEPNDPSYLGARSACSSTLTVPRTGRCSPCSRIAAKWRSASKRCSRL